MKTIRNITTPIVAIAAFFGLILIASTTVSAEPTTINASGQALEISPPVLNVSGNPGQTIEATIKLRDVSTTSLLVTSQVNDFTANGENGSPKILLDSTEKNPYSIIDWVSPLPDMTLKPKQIQNLPVSIKIPSNAAPGGYFGEIRFTATAPGIDKSGVSLSASLGALVLLKVNGNAKEQIDLEEFFVTKDGSRGTVFESTPLEFTQRIKNSGNLHEQPTGQIAITDMFGNLATNINVNLETRNILPQTIRRFDQPLNSSSLGNRMLFGRYTAKLTLKYGDNKTTTSELSFWVIPYRLIAGIVIGLVTLVFVARYLIKRYNERLLRSSGGQSRRR